MILMAKLDRARIRRARAGDREVRMSAIETGDIRFLFRMALRTRLVAGEGQLEGSLMLDVTLGTTRREGLLRLMDWTVVTRQARQISHGPAERRILQATRSALTGEPRLTPRHT